MAATHKKLSDALGAAIVMVFGRRFGLRSVGGYDQGSKSFALFELSNHNTSMCNSILEFGL